MHIVRRIDCLKCALQPFAAQINLGNLENMSTRKSENDAKYSILTILLPNFHSIYVKFFMGKHSKKLLTSLDRCHADEVEVNNQCHRYQQVCNVHGSPMLNL